MLKAILDYNRCAWQVGPATTRQCILTVVGSHAYDKKLDPDYVQAISDYDSCFKVSKSLIL